MAEYYVVRDKNTGLYFRGKGVNRWGKYYNQASIYRIKANAENTIKEVSWKGEQAEIVPIQIVETAADVVPKSEVDWNSIPVDVSEALKQRAVKKAKAEVAREIFAEIEKKSCVISETNHSTGFTRVVCYQISADKLAELKKKYQEGESNGSKQ